MTAADALIAMTARAEERQRTMASSTLRCGYARCDCCCSQKPFPAERTTSATSKVGRLIASSVSWNASPRRAPIGQWLPEGWGSPAGAGATNADTPSYRRACASQKNLDGAEIGSGFQHGGCKAMSQGMRRDCLAMPARLAASFTACQTIFSVMGTSARQPFTLPGKR